MEKVFDILEPIMTLLLVYFFAPSFVISLNPIMGIRNKFIDFLKQILRFLHFKLPNGTTNVDILTHGNIRFYTLQLAVLIVFIIFQWGKLLFVICKNLVLS